MPISIRDVFYLFMNDGHLARPRILSVWENTIATVGFQVNLNLFSLVQMKVPEQNFSLDQI